MTDQRKDKGAEEVPLQPVPVPPPEHLADPSLTVTICVAGMVASAEVSSSFLKTQSNLRLKLHAACLRGIITCAMGPFIGGCSFPG